MALASLIKAGWPLDKEKLRLELEKSNLQELLKAAKKKELVEFLLNIDIVRVSKPTLPKDLSKLKFPVVLQLSRWRNVSHSAVQDHQGNTGVCRLEFTDGHTKIKGFSTEPLNKLSGKTPYGAKVLLKSPTKLEQGYLQLNNTNLELLGGEVMELREGWSKERMQIDTKLESRAPKWVSVERHTEKKREADELCREFNSFECFANIPWITQQEKKDEKTDNEFNRKRKSTIESIIVPRKRPKFLFHRHW